MNPDLNITATVTLWGESHTLKYGFRALHELGVNPFDPASVRAFEETPQGIPEMAKQVWAGILHEYRGRTAPRKGEPEPTVEDVIDELDPEKYVAIISALLAAKGDTPKAEAETPENPPQA